MLNKATPIWPNAIARAIISAAKIDDQVAGLPAPYRSKEALESVTQSCALLIDAYEKDRDYEEVRRKKIQEKERVAEKAEDAARALLAEIDAEENEGPKAKQSKKKKKMLKLQQQEAKPPPTSPTKKTAVAAEPAASPSPPSADSWELFLAAMALDGAEVFPPQPNTKK